MICSGDIPIDKTRKQNGEEDEDFVPDSRTGRY